MFQKVKMVEIQCNNRFVDKIHQLLKIQRKMQDQFLNKVSQEKCKSEAFITKVVLNISISCIIMGYSNAYFSSIDYQDFVRIFEITEHKALYQGLLTGLVPLTAGIGGFLASFLLKKFSRVNCFLVLNLAYSLIIFGLMFKTITTLIVFRLIQGCFIGIISSIVPLYIKEFSPLQLNGKMGTFFQMLTVFGLGLAFLVSYVCSLFLTPQIYWRIVYIFPLFLICVQSYNLFYNYRFETPKYLLSIQKIEQARQLLNVIYKEEYIDERLQELRKMFFLASNKKSIELKQINRQQRTETKQTETTLGLKPEENQKKDIEYHNNKLAVYAAIHTLTLQNFSGIYIVIGYGAQIIKRVFPSLAKIMPIFLHFEAVIACFLTIELLKNYGRKTLTQYGCVGCGIFTLMLGYAMATIGSQVKQISVTTGLIVLISMFTYRFIYGVTIGPVAFLYVSQIVQPNIMPIIIVFYWFATALTMMLFPIIRFSFFQGNPGPVFLFFAVYTLISILINHYVLVQTKGKKQYQVRMQYDRILGIKHKQDDQSKEICTK